jgi:choline dehydrogenase-like flavoprotein
VTKGHDFDIIIIGTGAGGGTMAHALSETGANILLLERGDFVPQEEENWNPEAVWKHRRYQTRERWLDRDGREFSPYTHYGVGGNTKFWGSVLYRLRREDFQAVEHRDGLSPAWPIDYETLAPYYDRAEQLYHVRGKVGFDPTEPPRGPYPYDPVPHAPGMAEIVENLRAQGLHPAPLPLGLIRPARTAVASSATPAIRSRASCTRKAKRTSAASAPRSSGRTSRCGPTPARGGS